jgi:DNA-binding NtrC family response regulator
VMRAMMDYEWPGNVRELENAIEMAVALSGDRTLLSAADFPLEPRTHFATARPPVPAVLETGMNYEQTLASIERGILRHALARTGGNKKAAAELLGLKRTTLCAKVRSLELAGAGV